MDEKIKVYTPHEAYELCMSNDTILLDIREKEMSDYKKFDVPKQIHISITDLDEKWIILPLNKLIIIADNNGVLAQKPADFLHEQGFRVAILKGGIVEWEHVGLQLIENCCERTPCSCSCKNYSI